MLLLSLVTRHACRASQLTDDPVRLQLKPKLEPNELQIEWNLSVPEMTDKELEEAILAAHAEAQHLEDWRFEDFNESSQPPASAARPVLGNEEDTMLNGGMQGNQVRSLCTPACRRADQLLIGEGRLSGLLDGLCCNTKQRIIALVLDVLAKGKDLYFLLSHAGSCGGTRL